MKVVVATVQVPFVRGGAETLAEDLVGALRQAGHEGELVSIPFNWSPPARILDHMLACRLLDFSGPAVGNIDLVIGLKFPAYFVNHTNKILWLIHQHRPAYDLWGHPHYGDLHKLPGGQMVREAIRLADSRLIAEARGVFAISQKVAERLQHFNGLKSEALYHPPRDERLYHSTGAGNYVLFPSRLNPTKRQRLAIEALGLCRQPVRLRILGPSESPAYDEELRSAAKRAGVDNRVEWSGPVSQPEKIAAYAGCLGVVFPPVDEDYGYVTLEAMLARKPVITCCDSGGPLEFVVDDTTGFIVEPTPNALAAAFDRLWDDRAKAVELGENGRAHYEQKGIAWPAVIRRLLGDQRG
jgi:glycosyltransferase involved in cell wall biosynthesis